MATSILSDVNKINQGYATAMNGSTINLNFCYKTGHMVYAKVRAIANQAIPANTPFMKLPWKPIVDGWKKDDQDRTGMCYLNADGTVYRDTAISQGEICAYYYDMVYMTSE